MLQLVIGWYPTYHNSICIFWNIAVIKQKFSLSGQNDFCDIFNFGVSNYLMRKMKFLFCLIILTCLSGVTEWILFWLLIVSEQHTRTCVIAGWPCRRRSWVWKLNEASAPSEGDSSAPLNLFWRARQSLGGSLSERPPTLHSGPPSSALLPWNCPVSLCYTKLESVKRYNSTIQC